jgi:hypothetical protein
MITNALTWLEWVAIGVVLYPPFVIGVAKILKGRFK